MASSHIDRLLANARLTPTTPYTQADIDAGAARLTARLAGHHEEHPPTPPSGRDREDGALSDGAQSAARDLQTLCETIATRPDVLRTLRYFLAQSAMPQPSGARVFGCVLQLAASEDSARFWWQYAAGAGDSAAAYCLYLHHRALGEDDEADWWRTQARPAQATPDDRQTTTALEVALALRVLRGLKDDRTLPDTLTTLMVYVPAAVAFVDDDLDLPLPDDDFTDRIKTLIGPPPRTPRNRNSNSLPARRPGCALRRRLHETEDACPV
ncbi:hypothetical protein N566_24675 [Streptomycetaceae bacterium MP113-05]|nr:hypothetical protein N566_24675 [Streptomycetaceae bacterium MP113-05]